MSSDPIVSPAGGGPGDRGAPPSERGPGRPATVVTLSASYGAGGSVVGPRLAEQLGLPFVDRLLRRKLATDAGQASLLERRSAEHLTAEEAGAAVSNRLLDYLAHAATVGVMPLAADAFESESALRDQAEAPCLEATRTGGVILGRAAAVVLHNVQGVYHVRLSGPESRRRQRATELENIGEEEAANRLVHTDRARELWVKRLYRAEAKDPGWYHLLLDTTVLPLEDVVEVIASAATRYWAADLPAGW